MRSGQKTQSPDWLLLGRALEGQDSPVEGAESFSPGAWLVECSVLDYILGISSTCVG